MSRFDHERAAHFDAQAHTAIIGYQALHETCLVCLARHLQGRGRVLVVGTGTGNDTVMIKERFPELEIVAIDPSEPMLNIARAKFSQRSWNIDVRCGRLEDFDDLGGFDAAVMIGILHHLDNAQQQEDLIKLVRQHLNPGGLLLSGSQHGPLSPLRLGVWEQRWRDAGASDQDVAQRHAMLSQIVPVPSEPFQEWLRLSQFQVCERVFASLFFEVWACQ